MLFGFQFEIIDIDIAILQCFYNNHFHAGHYCRRRVGTVRRYRYQHHIPVMMTICFMIGFDRQQTCIFSLRTTVRLQAAGIRPSGFRFQVSSY